MAENLGAKIEGRLRGRWFEPGNANLVQCIIQESFGKPWIKQLGAFAVHVS